MKVARIAQVAAWYVFKPCVGAAFLAVLINADLPRGMSWLTPFVCIVAWRVLARIALRPPTFVDKNRRTDPLDNLGMAGAILPLGGVMLAMDVPMTTSALIAVLAPLTIVGTCLIMFSAVKRAEIFFAADASIHTTRQTGRAVL